VYCKVSSTAQYHTANSRTADKTHKGTHVCKCSCPNRAALPQEQQPRKFAQRQQQLPFTTLSPLPHTQSTCCPSSRKQTVPGCQKALSLIKRTTCCWPNMHAALEGCSCAAAQAHHPKPY
jgi:hypothetical protein